MPRKGLCKSQPTVSFSIDCVSFPYLMLTVIVLRHLASLSKELARVYIFNQLVDWWCITRWSYFSTYLQLCNPNLMTISEILSVHISVSFSSLLVELNYTMSSRHDHTKLSLLFWFRHSFYQCILPFLNGSHHYKCKTTCSFVRSPILINIFYHCFEQFLNTRTRREKKYRNTYTQH